MIFEPLSVNVPKQEYEKLVRESETLKIVTMLVKNNKYINAPELKAVLGIESEEVKDGIENL